MAVVGDDVGAAKEVVVLCVQGWGGEGMGWSWESGVEGLEDGRKQEVGGRNGEME